MNAFDCQQYYAIFLTYQAALLSINSVYCFCHWQKVFQLLPLMETFKNVTLFFNSELT